MEQTTIGVSGLRTSRIGLGTWAIDGWMWGGTDPLSPEFMAPPPTRRSAQHLSTN